MGGPVHSRLDTAMRPPLVSSDEARRDLSSRASALCARARDLLSSSPAGARWGKSRSLARALRALARDDSRGRAFVKNEERGETLIRRSRGSRSPRSLETAGPAVTKTAGPAL